MSGTLGSHAARAAPAAVQTNIYAAPAAGWRSPATAAARALVYVPNTMSNSVTVIDSLPRAETINAASPPFARGSGAALALICTAQFVLQLDFSIVNVALPTIQRQLGFTSAHLQWIVTGYALTFGSLLLLGGRVGDLIGRRRLLLVGLSLFGVSSLSAGLAPSQAMLIGSRFVQGASAALVAPSALALLTALFREGPPRTRALGIFQGATAAGAMAGVVLGGLLTEYTSWRAIFSTHQKSDKVTIEYNTRIYYGQLSK